ncbi:hypothetical protein QQS21_010349 [Conoideocrella luteorostrata]|uniref:Uncharacterized protein n=1 Tax=Conoideocrella luteorostrata TaxID=1105319 RepID=A0AAJ0FWY3_9HYPO|nr:hypothetical protein QQS21_010349 [Conoideocrella luteorostrata]
MSDLAQSKHSPPSYNTSIGHTTPTSAPTEALLPPGSLCIRGRFIRSGNAKGDLLYELSHHLDSLKETDRKVVLEKVERSVSQSLVDEPVIKHRNRALYELKHPKPGELCIFSYQAEAQSRHAPGCLGLRKTHGLIGRQRFEIVHARWGSDGRLIMSEGDGKEGVLFQVAGASSSTVKGAGGGSSGVLWQWEDAEGKVLAREVINEEEDLSLVVTTEMTLQMRNALAAAWYLRIWYVRGEETRERDGFLAKVQRIFDPKSGVYSGIGGGRFGGRLSASGL